MIEYLKWKDIANMIGKPVYDMLADEWKILDGYKETRGEGRMINGGDGYKQWVENRFTNVEF